MAAVFDPNRCAHVGENLWRGNLPLRADRTFAFDELRKVLGIDSSTSFVDVSVIDNVKGSERDVWQPEVEAFGVDVDATWPSNRPDIPPQFNQTIPAWNPGSLHGSTDRLMWWQIEGGDNSIVLGPSKRSYNFIGYVERLAELNGIGCPVYVHCMNGTDRTGASVAAFAMRVMGYTLDQAFKLADSVKAAGTMNSDYVELVKAYAREKGFK
jgi:hypothetical protein